METRTEEQVLMTDATTNPAANRTTKEELIAYIKEWIKIDTDVIKLKADIKEKMSRKKTLTESLVTIMKKNSIDCFDINGGTLIYKQKKTKKPISVKYLLAELQKYYKDQPDIASDLTKQILENRELNIKEEICRKINK
jgi:septum formation topological specificity factor MinE